MTGHGARDVPGPSGTREQSTKSSSPPTPTKGDGSRQGPHFFPYLIPWPSGGAVLDGENQSSSAETVVPTAINRLEVGRWRSLPGTRI